MRKMGEMDPPPSRGREYMMEENNEKDRSYNKAI